MNETTNLKIKTKATLVLTFYLFRSFVSYMTTRRYELSTRSYVRDSGMERLQLHCTTGSILSKT